MRTQTELADFLLNGHKYFISHVSIDCAIFGYHEQQLKLLLIQNMGVNGWCLPGGYVKRTEKLVEAAARNVRERTGVDNLFLHQFRAFGDPNRARHEEFDTEKIFKFTGIRLDENNWLLDHTISIGFYAITDFSKTELNSDLMTVDCQWFDIENLPKLEFDHDEMVKEAFHTMRVHLYHYPIGINMLPEKFTLTEIHNLYQTLVGKKLDISNFPKKLIKIGLLKKLNEKRSIGAHRAPHLYSFDRSRYENALKEGLVLT